MKETKKEKTGPKPETVKIKGDWEKAVGDALKKKPPKGGWLEPEKEEKKPKD